MNVTQTGLAGLLLLLPRVFSDERGSLYESFNQRRFDEAVGQHIEFVQDNHSRSLRGVLRGLHLQRTPREQGKLVRATLGAVFDVAVDLRESSPTYGQWEGFELSAINHRQLWIPAGFAHGFFVVSDVAEVQYKTTDYYSPQHEESIRWDDASLAIAWPIGESAPVLSAKDAAARPLAARR